jgi:hypothetical protein
MTAKSENRYKANSLAKARHLSTEAAERETLLLGRRDGKSAAPAAPQWADQRTARNWMRRNSLGYDSATELAEAAACALDFRGGDPCGDETHWIWDLAADCFDA